MTATPQPLPRLADWLGGEGASFVRELLDCPGSVDAGWFRAWYRGFGDPHYALVLSEPPISPDRPTIEDPRPPYWDSGRIDNADIAQAIASSAMDPASANRHPDGLWWIRREADHLVVYIEMATIGPNPHRC